MLKVLEFNREMNPLKGLVEVCHHLVGADSSVKYLQGSFTSVESKLRVLAEGKSCTCSGALRGFSETVGEGFSTKFSHVIG